MKKYLIYLFVILIGFLANCNFAYAQGGSATMRSRCPNSSDYQTFTLSASGSQASVLCSGGTFTINGAAVTTGGGAISGGTANYIPRYSSATALTTTPFSWDGTTYTFQSTVLTSQFKMIFTPSVTGRFAVGDYETSPTNYLDLQQSSGTLTLQSTNTLSLISVLGNVSLAGTIGVDIETATFNVNASNSGAINSVNDITLGDASGAGSDTKFIVNDTDGKFTFRKGANDAIFDVTGVGSFLLNRTVTAGGTTGNQTISKPNGSVNFAAGTAALTVTNTTVSTSSLIIATAQTNDATCSVKNVVAGSGSFVINMTANCTAETRVAFWVWN